MTNIIVVDSRPYVRYRVKELIETKNICVYDAANSNQLFKVLKELNNEVSLIIIDILLRDEDGIEIIKKLHKRNLFITFMILTSINTREAFIKSVKAGAVDYFLKPFDEKKFSKRVLNHLRGNHKINAYDSGGSKKETFNEYLIDELYNAKEGNYKVSFILFLLFKSREDMTIDLHSDHEIFTTYAYDKIKALSKEMNRFEKYGLNSFIGVFSKCDKEKIINISNDIRNKVIELKEEDPVLSQYYFDCVHSTFPEDGNGKEEIIENLTKKLNDKILMLREKENSN